MNNIQENTCLKLLQSIDAYDKDEKKKHKGIVIYNKNKANSIDSISIADYFARNPLSTYEFVPFVFDEEKDLCMIKFKFVHNVTFKNTNLSATSLSSLTGNVMPRFLYSFIFMDKTRRQPINNYFVSAGYERRTYLPNDFDSCSIDISLSDYDNTNEPLFISFANNDCQIDEINTRKKIHHHNVLKLQIKLQPIEVIKTRYRKHATHVNVKDVGTICMELNSNTSITSHNLKAFNGKIRCEIFVNLLFTMI